VRLFHCVPPENLGEVFSAEKDAALFPLLNGWINEISAHYEKLKSAFAAGDGPQLESCRGRAVEILSRYPVSPDHLQEWFRVALMYRGRLNDPEVPPGEVEEKLLYRGDEFSALLDRVSVRFDRLEDLRQKLLTANLRLVVSIVRPFRCESVQTGDLIQEGNLGLIKALERFDHRLGHKFSTYATWWIRQAVSKAIAAQSRIIRLPAHMLNSISRINRAERMFIQKHGREPEVSELASILEMPRERVNAIRRMAAQSISLQAPVSDDLNSPVFEQYLSTEEEDSPAKQIAFQFLQDRLSQAMEKLTELEQQIITLHFGLSGKKPMTLVELSELCGLTRERIRQLESRALKKLKDPSFTMDFQDYFS
jgi:RNA polymerase primary sigma factor